MSDVAETLDPLRLPLQGERLIEASAGTGKTFTIAALYLRLLLGLGGSAAFPRPLTVEELLVVTFTEAATAELRGRIRSNIHELRIACLRETTDNPLYERLLEEIDDKAQAAQWLLLAERQMDEAAVFTIHGFCQRMLNLNAFESGMLFEQQLIEDESLLRYQACADFWRRHCYPLPREIAQVVFETWKGPQAVLRDIKRYLQGEAPVIKAPPPDDETLASRHAQIVARIDTVKQQWRDAVGELDALIESSGIDRRKFNRSMISLSISGYPRDVRIINRSNCDSGSECVPIEPKGFCVAITIYGSGRSLVIPSTVICPSSIASRSADCVFGDVRLISSASKRFVIAAPSLNSNSSLP